MGHDRRWCVLERVVDHVFGGLAAGAGSRKSKRRLRTYCNHDLAVEEKVVCLLLANRLLSARQEILPTSTEPRPLELARRTLLLCTFLHAVTHKRWHYRARITISEALCLLPIGESCHGSLSSPAALYGLHALYATDTAMSAYSIPRPRCSNHAQSLLRSR